MSKRFGCSKNRALSDGTASNHYLRPIHGEQKKGCKQIRENTDQKKLRIWTLSRSD